MALPVNRRIIIEGEVARIVETTVIAETPLSALSEYLETYKPTVLPILPHNTCHVAYDPNTKVGQLVVEIAPTRHHLKFHYRNGDFDTDHVDYSRRDHNDLAVFHIQMPWLYLAYSFILDTADNSRDNTTGREQRLQNFTITDVHFYARPRPVTANDNSLWVMPLANVYGDGRICWGTTTASTGSLAERINDQVNMFTSTTFNNDLGLNTPNAYDSYDAWEKASSDPTCFTAWEEFTRTPPVTLANFSPEPLPDLRAVFNVPPPPPIFTIGRAREWFTTITLPQRRAFLLAMQRAIDETAAPEPEPPTFTLPPSPPLPALDLTPTIDLAELARQALAETRDADLRNDDEEEEDDEDEDNRPNLPGEPVTW